MLVAHLSSCGKTAKCQQERIGKYTEQHKMELKYEGSTVRTSHTSLLTQEVNLNYSFLSTINRPQDIFNILFFPLATMLKFQFLIF